MIDSLEKLNPFDWDLVRVPVIAGAGVTAAMYDTIITRGIETLTLIYVAVKVYRLFFPRRKDS